MFRPHVADHVMFDECMRVFRRAEASELYVDYTVEQEMVEQDPFLKKLEMDYLLLDFDLPQALEFDGFKILPTRYVNLPFVNFAYVAPVELPSWPGRQHGHRFTIALSAVFSFLLGRPATISRDDLRRPVDPAHAESLVPIGMYMPISLGSLGNDPHLAQKTVIAYHSSFMEGLAALDKLSSKNYFQIMQAICLVQLAHLNKREDFALAYYLLVSAIEAVAQLAVKRKEVAQKHPSEQEWSKLAKTNKVVKELSAAFRAERGKNNYLKQRFIEFVLRYSPVNVWDELEHPSANSQALMEEMSSEFTGEWTRKRWWDLYPSELSNEHIREVLADVYTYRSKYTHEGKAPPHFNPTSTNRYFDVQTEYDLETGNRKDIVLPTFRLIAFIARRSILAYIQERAKSQT